MLSFNYNYTKLRVLHFTNYFWFNIYMMVDHLWIIVNIIYKHILQYAYGHLLQYLYLGFTL
jgi:hypothetical protein